MIVHKSDVGGVAVDIRSDDQLEAAFSRLAGLDGFQGVLVEEMLPRGVELIVGATIDLQFGPISSSAWAVPPWRSTRTRP